MSALCEQYVLKKHSTRMWSLNDLEKILPGSGCSCFGNQLCLDAVFNVLKTDFARIWPIPNSKSPRATGGGSAVDQWWNKTVFPTC